MMPGKCRALNLETASGRPRNAAEKVKAGIRAKVEHPIRVIKCQFGFTKVRYRCLGKNISGLQTLFALSNLWMVRKHLLQEMTGQIRPKSPERSEIRESRAESDYDLSQFSETDPKTTFTLIVKPQNISVSDHP